jgi:hypothetical protein
MAAPHVTVKAIATTWEKRKVWAVRVGPVSDTGAAVPTIYVIGTHHAREWASEEVTLELLRYYANGVSSDRNIQAQLANAAIVFVPVANPDGYQYTRNPSAGLPGDRAQRKNRRSDQCATVANQGVDLNRNYSILWGAPSDSMSTNACDPQVYIGPSSASEPEVVGIQNLLLGTAFQNATGGFKQIPTASISYHTYSDDLLYPGGFKLNTDANGPRCRPQDNCVNPDFIIYRRLFGDYENPVMIDTTLVPSLAVPTGMQNTVAYSTSGDTNAFAQNAATPSLSVTPELTSKSVGFYIECESDYQNIVAAWVANQKTLISRVLDASPKLASSTPASSYGPPVFSAGFALTSWARETSDTLDEQTARARLIIGAFRPTDPFTPFSMAVDGAAATAKPARRGAQYDAYLYDPPNPLKLPCVVLGRERGVDSGMKGGCTQPIDLCDPNRLPHDSGWTLKHAPRGSVDDCWWEPVASATSDGILTIPSSSGFPPNTTQCQLMFTTDWDANQGGSPVLLQRFHGGAWTDVTRWPFASPPIYETRTFVSGGRLRTEAVESNATVPGPTDAFRFIVKAGTQPKFQLFDPVIYCRFGPRP